MVERNWFLYIQVLSLKYQITNKLNDMTQLINYIIAREEAKEEAGPNLDEKLQQLEAAYREEKAIREAQEDAEFLTQIEALINNGE